MTTFPDTLRVSLSTNGTQYSNVKASVLQGLGVADELILAAAKSAMADRIDAAAEKLRETVLTPGAGQAMEYQEVQAQAFAALASPSSATAALYPMLAATIGIDIDPTTKAPAVDVLGVARSVVASFTAWGSLGAAIRGARMKGKASVAAATDFPSALAAFQSVPWPATGG